MLTRLIDSFGFGDPPKLTGNPSKDVEILAKSLGDTRAAVLKLLRDLNQPGVLDITESSISDSTVDGSTVGGTTPDAGFFTTINASGLISANGGQIAFPAVQNASANANTLDDYEEVDWTPNPVFATPGDLLTAFSTQVGKATKIGRLVIASFAIQTSTFTHTTAAGLLQVTGLPYAAANVSGYEAVVPLSVWQGITKAGYTQISGRVSANSSTIFFTGSGSGVAASGVSVADVPSGGSVALFGVAIYIV